MVRLSRRKSVCFVAPALARRPVRPGGRAGGDRERRLRGRAGRPAARTSGAGLSGESKSSAGSSAGGLVVAAVGGERSETSCPAGEPRGVVPVDHGRSPIESL